MAVSLPATGTRKYWLVASFGSVLLFLFLLPQPFLRYQIQSAQNAFNSGSLSEMALPLQHAESILKFPGLTIDSKRLALLKGELKFEEGRRSKNVETMLTDMESANEHFREVVKLVPKDLDGWTGRARSTEILERLYPFIKKKPYQERALPQFEQLLQLMPTNLYAVSLLVRFFDSRKLPSQRDQMVLRSVYLSPDLFYQLRRQPYHSLELEQKLKTPLLKSATDNINPDQAYRALSDIYLKEGDITTAIYYYEKTQPQDGYRDNSYYFIAIGNLRLQAKQYDTAVTSFLKGIENGSLSERRKRLNTVFGYYRRNKEFSAFLKFCDIAEQKFNTGDLVEFLRAEALFQMGQYGFARSHLLKISSSKYLSRSFALRARIAEKQKDWDEMELTSQRATVLAPENYSYFVLFSRSLTHQKKFIQAERAASEAIEISHGKSPWLYNHRAWIRWSLKNNDGALKDWEHAVSISPDNAGFYYNMGRVYERGGNLPAAIEQIEKAIRKAPGKEEYRNKLSALKAKLQQGSQSK